MLCLISSRCHNGRVALASRQCRQSRRNAVRTGKMPVAPSVITEMNLFSCLTEERTKTMARKTPSRLAKRKEIEAAELQETASAKKTTKKKAAKKKTTTRTKVKKAPERKRLLWGVYSGSMKEEARFPYDQREAAEAKIEKLRAKSKKMYFIQPIKEVIIDAPASAESEGAKIK